MSDGDNPSQVTEDVQPTVSSETTTSQAPVADASPSPGAETTAEGTTPATVTTAGQPTPPTKTYTQAEWDAQQAQLMAAKDREIQQHKDALAQIAMREQIARVQAFEAQAQAKDRQDVEAGAITETEAQTRAAARMQTLQVQAQAQQSQAQFQAMQQQGEALGRVLMARDLAKEYGIDADALAKDNTLTTPLAMVKKAAALALKARDDQLRAAKAKPESFDKGPQAETTGPATEDQRLRSRYPSMFK